MATFYDLIYTLQDYGVADVLLPFLLAFTVSFAILRKTKVLGTDPETRRFDLIVALVMGFALIVPHVVWGTPDPYNIYLANGMVDPVKLINSSLPSISVVIIAVIMVMLLLGVFGTRFNIGSKINVGIMIFAIGTVVYVFGTNAGYFGSGRFPAWLWFLANPGTQSLLIVILVFGVIVWFITKPEISDQEKERRRKDGWRNFIEGMGGHDDGHHK